MSIVSACSLLSVRVVVPISLGFTILGSPCLDQILPRSLPQSIPLPSSVPPFIPSLLSLFLSTLSFSPFPCNTMVWLCMSMTLSSPKTGSLFPKTGMSSDRPPSPSVGVRQRLVFVSQVTESRPPERVLV